MARNRLLLRIDLLNKSRWSGHAMWQITGDALGADLARTPTTPDPRKSYVLTERQIAVVKSLGAGNRTGSCCELNMIESTMKAHVRNTMKKLRARNRTKVVLMRSDLVEGDCA